MKRTSNATVSVVSVNGTAPSTKRPRKAITAASVVLPPPDLASVLADTFKGIVSASMELSYPTDHSLSSLLTSWLLVTHRITYGPIRNKEGKPITCAAERLVHNQEELAKWEHAAGNKPDFDTDLRTIMYRKKLALAKVRCVTFVRLCAQLKQVYFETTGREWVYTPHANEPQPAPNEG